MLYLVSNSKSDSDSGDMLYAAIMENLTMGTDYKPQVHVLLILQMVNIYPVTIKIT